jgi:hypothetical protein
MKMTAEPVRISENVALILLSLLWLAHVMMNQF